MQMTIARGKKTILTNNFHGTSATVIPLVTGYLSPAQVRRAAKTLCPFRGCTCGKTALKYRGWQKHAIDVEQDGSAMLYAGTSS
jgi:hypothetical protein